MFKNNVKMSDGSIEYIPETKSKGTWEYYKPYDPDYKIISGNWVQEVEHNSVIYKSPMDTYEYVSTRTPISQRPEGNYPNYIKDSIVHRESIMASQSITFNRIKYNRL